MVEALGQIEVATSLIKNIYSLEDPLYSHYQCLCCELTPLEADSKEFSNIKTYVQNTGNENYHKVDILQVFRASRKGETERFEKFSCTKNRMLLWYGSQLTNWTGLPIAPPEAPVSGYNFDKGVYFADMFAKSLVYCGTNNVYPDVVLTLCEVSSFTIRFPTSVYFPFFFSFSFSYYTTYQILYRSSNFSKLFLTSFTKALGRQILEDGLIVPLGKPKELSELKVDRTQNEYVVYNIEQIRMRYVVHATSNATQYLFFRGTRPVEKNNIQSYRDTNIMAQQQPPLDQQLDQPLQQSAQPPREDMLSCVTALEAALLPCLPARELQAIDRSPHPSHQIDVERHARDFMEAAKKLQLYFNNLQREDQPTKAELLRMEIATMEEELKTKNELIEKHERLIQGWRKELKDQLVKHNTELDRV
ncbi:hypothetical protein ACOSQ4_000434 [Xanthoceras sorbifolium]